MSFTRRLMLVAAAALTVTACSKTDAATGEMAMGKANAPVTVVEYASVTCSHCARFNEDVFPAFKAKYVDTGQVRYVFREFLTPPEPVAAAGFLVARCAGPTKYFGVVDSIFKSQEEMFRTQDWRGTLLRVAQSAGMTEQQFEACVSNQAELKAISGRVDEGVKAGVTATPTFMVNGKKLEGEQTLAALDAAIASAKK